MKYLPLIVGAIIALALVYLLGGPWGAGEHPADPRFVRPGDQTIFPGRK